MSRPTNLRRLPYGYERFDVDSFGDGLRTLELLSAIGLELSRPLASELRRSFCPKTSRTPAATLAGRGGGATRALANGLSLNSMASNIASAAHRRRFALPL